MFTTLPPALVSSTSGILLFRCTSWWMPWFRVVCLPLTFNNSNILDYNICVLINCRQFHNRCIFLHLIIQKNIREKLLHRETDLFGRKIRIPERNNSTCNEYSLFANTSIDVEEMIDVLYNKYSNSSRTREFHRRERDIEDRSRSRAPSWKFDFKRFSI